MQITTLLVALLSAISALIGLAFGHVLSVRRARRDELEAMKLAAYVDFIRATARLFTARRAGRTEDEIDELSLLNDAKTRVLLTADLPVVTRLEKFWLEGGTLEKEQEILAFRGLCDAMRESLGKERLSLKLDLAGVLFMVQPSTYSYKASQPNE